VNVGYADSHDRAAIALTSCLVLSSQRQDYKLRLQNKSSRLSDERMKQLNDLGFKWHIRFQSYDGMKTAKK
jgi:hypothetical protein